MRHRFARPLLRTAALACILFLFACAPAADSSSTTPPLDEPQIRVVIDGLLAPVGMAALPDGSLVVAEEGTGQRDDSAGVSLISPDGRVGRLISGLPSTRDAGDLAGASLVAVAPDGELLYVGNFGAGHLWTLSLPADTPLTLPETPYGPADLGQAMARLNNVFLINPFDMTFDAAGVPVVTDASGNGVAKATAEGATRFLHRFDRLPNPVRETDPIEAVPTGITRVDREYFVTLTGGCPYPAGGGQLVAIDEERNQRMVLDGLNMPIDIAQGPAGALWLLEFATFTPDASCFTGQGYQVETGRLSLVRPDGSRETVLEGLNFPGAVLPMADGSLYISEVFDGRILHVTFGAQDEAAVETVPAFPTEAASHRETTPAAITTADLDDALTAVIATRTLRANPGADLREEETPQAELGRLLFFDPILSGDRNISCATCHHPAFAMGDGRVLPIGTGGHGLGPARRFVEQVVLGEEAGANRRLAAVDETAGGDAVVPNPFVGQFVPRNSPTILNSALLSVQFWDGRVQGYAMLDNGEPDGVAAVKTQERVVNDMALTDPLATQALFPVASLHEMAGATFGGLAPQTIRDRLLARLRASPTYVDLFRTTFGTPDEGAQEAVTLLRMVEALAAFERRFIYTDAPWDRYLAGDATALTSAQKQGALLFFGAVDPAVNCAACHSGDLFTDQQFHNLLAPQLGPGKGNGYTGREDWGRAGVTFDARDRYAFRTPPLRNVTLTAPYFHAGSFATLEEAIRHHAAPQESALAYDPSAHAIPPDLYSSLQPVNLPTQARTLAPEVAQGLLLSETQIAQLTAFLEALTDPAARDLLDFIPAEVPSGLPLDPLPAAQVAAMATPATPKRAAPTEPEPQNGRAAVTDLQLSDVAAQVGLEFHHGAFQESVYNDPVAAMGGGLCWLDFDRDGRLDLYLVNSHAEDEAARLAESGGLPRNALYRNQAGRFTDVSAGSGTDAAVRGNGCTAADFNNDGWTDLFVTVYGPNLLFWNNGDGTFTEGAAAAGLAAPEWNASAAAGDLNGDGLLDLFVTGYIDFDKQIPKPIGAFPQDYYGIPDRLYINNGLQQGPAGQLRATFTEVTAAAGLTREERGLGALFSDLDDDGDLDLYIANDGHPNRLYANEPWPGGAAADPAGIGFRLADLTETANVGDSGSGMGVAGGDYDGDGLLDLFITNWERELNALYRNEVAEEGHLTFQYSTFRIGISGLGNGMTGWGAHLLDLDQDTDQDLLIVNGRVPVTNLRTDPELVRYYRNRSWSSDGPSGRPGHFLEWTEQIGLKDVGTLLGRGSAAADFDNDGDLDVAINTIAGPAALLRNDLNQRGGAGANWLMVEPEGGVPGVRVTVTLPDGRTLVREVHGGSSYLATEAPQLHFGLGRVDAAPQVQVRWPDGRTTVLQNVPANQRLRVSP